MHGQKKTQQITYFIICAVLLASSFFLFAVWKEHNDEKIGMLTSRSAFKQQETISIVQKEKKSYSDTSTEINTTEEHTSSTNPNTTNTQEDADTPETKPSTPGDIGEQKQYVTISIDMKNILQHMDLVDANYRPYIPSNGIVLSNKQVAFTEGDSVFTILKRACKEYDILLTADNGYVRFIHNIGEFDAGPTSGWLYTVNGTSPSIGSNSYKVKENDVIAWRYTVIQGDV